MPTDKPARSVKWRRRLLVLSMIGIVSLYAGGYGWARQAGLFRGEIETFVPYGGTPSGEYEIKPIGHLSLGTHPQDTERLRSGQQLSRQLWKIYWPIAELEELFR